MAFDPSKFISDLNTIKDDMKKLLQSSLELSDSLGDLADNANSCGGKIRGTIAPALVSLSDSLFSITETNKGLPKKLDELSEYINSMPYKDLVDAKKLQRSELKKQLKLDKDEDDEEENKRSLPQDIADEFTPNLNDGPKSSIIFESSDNPLEKYFSNNGGIAKKTILQENINGNFSMKNIIASGLGGDIDRTTNAMLNEQLGVAKVPSHIINKLKETIINTPVEETGDVELDATFNWQSYKSPLESISLADM